MCPEWWTELWNNVSQSVASGLRGHLQNFVIHFKMTKNIFMINLFKKATCYSIFIGPIFEVKISFMLSLVGNSHWRNTLSLISYICYFTNCCVYSQNHVNTPKKTFTQKQQRGILHLRLISTVTLDFKLDHSIFMFGNSCCRRLQNRKAVEHQEWSFPLNKQNSYHIPYFINADRISRHF